MFGSTSYTVRGSGRSEAELFGVIEVNSHLFLLGPRPLYLPRFFEFAAAGHSLRHHRCFLRNVSLVLLLVLRASYSFLKSELHPVPRPFHLTSGWLHLRICSLQTSDQSSVPKCMERVLQSCVLIHRPGSSLQ